MKTNLLRQSGLLVFALFLLLPGCAKVQMPEGASGATVEPNQALVYSSPNQLQTIRTQGVLRVGVSLYVPWVMHDNQGKLIGYEIEVAKQLAKDIGVEVQFVETSWPAILTGLLANEYEIIISGLALSPERALLINFSQPYHHSANMLIASRKVAGNTSSRARFNTPRMTVGVVKGSMGEQQLALALPRATIVPFDSEARSFAALLDGKISAIVASTPRTGYLLTKYKKSVYQPFAEPLSTYAEGFGVRKGDADMLNFLNTWIQCNTQNGWLPARQKHWFDTIDWAKQL